MMVLKEKVPQNKEKQKRKLIVIEEYPLHSRKGKYIWFLKVLITFSRIKETDKSGNGLFIKWFETTNLFPVTA